MAAEQELRGIYSQANQAHVFTFFDTLSPDQQSTFLAQLATIDPKRVNQVYSTATASEHASTAHATIQPPPPSVVGSVLSNPAGADEWNAIGLDAIRQGKVGVLLMAGGQGTRLGSSDPKGCYDIGLPSHKSLFQLQAERIRRLQTVAAAEKPIPWYIMTSGPTRAPTELFFEKHGYFGLEKESVIFFEQGLF